MGNISPLPRISLLAPGAAGMRNNVQSMASIAADVATCVPSHFTLPCSIKVMSPNTVPKIIMGCRRIRRRLKKPFMVRVLFQRSS